MSRRIDTLFLDAGNTLVSMDFELLCEMLAIHGVRCPPLALERAEAAARPALSRFLARPNPREAADAFTFHVGSILSALGGDAAAARDALAPRLVAELKRTVPTQRLWSRIVPGVPEALEALHDAGITLVVVSNSDGTVDQGLADLGLRRYLDHVVDSALLGVEKPDRRIFDHALGLAGCERERTVHVGDLYAVDVVGARAAGVDAVLLDPHGDWLEPDCATAPDLASVARQVLSAGGR